MTRYRLVTAQNTTGWAQHVSSVVLNQDEAAEQLDAEARMHELCGWTVTRGSDVIVCRRHHVIRSVSVKATDAMHDEREARR